MFFVSFIKEVDMKSKKMSVSRLVWAGILFAFFVYAQEVKMSGVLFLDYSYFLSEGAGDLNAFDVPRIYLDFEIPKSEKVRGFVQLEVNKISMDPWTGKASDANNQAPYVKKAFLEIKDLLGGHTFQMGLISTPWIGFEEKIWKHRFVSKVLPDIDGKLGSVDRGISLSKKFPRLEYALLFVNGEGRDKEATKHKDILGRVSFSLLERETGKLRAHLYLHKGKKETGNARDREIVGVSYEGKKFNAMGNYYLFKDGGTKGKAYSLHGVFFLSDKNWLFARVDNTNEDKDTPNTTIKRLIAGVGHTIAPQVKGALNLQFQDADESASKGTLRSLHYTVELKF